MAHGEKGRVRVGRRHSGRKGFRGRGGGGQERWCRGGGAGGWCKRAVEALSRGCQGIVKELSRNCEGKERQL